MILHKYLKNAHKYLKKKYNQIMRKLLILTLCLALCACAGTRTLDGETTKNWVKIVSSRMDNSGNIKDVCYVFDLTFDPGTAYDRIKDQPNSCLEKCCWYSENKTVSYDFNDGFTQDLSDKGTSRRYYPDTVTITMNYASFVNRLSARASSDVISRDGVVKLDYEDIESPEEIINADFNKYDAKVYTKEDAQRGSELKKTRKAEGDYKTVSMSGLNRDELLAQAQAEYDKDNEHAQDIADIYSDINDGEEIKPSSDFNTQVSPFDAEHRAMEKSMKEEEKAKKNALKAAQQEEEAAAASAEEVSKPKGTKKKNYKFVTTNKSKQTGANADGKTAKGAKASGNTKTTKGTATTKGAATTKNTSSTPKAATTKTATGAKTSSTPKTATKTAAATPKNTAAVTTSSTPKKTAATKNTAKTGNTKGTKKAASKTNTTAKNTTVAAAKNNKLNEIDDSDVKDYVKEKGKQAKEAAEEIAESNKAPEKKRRVEPEYDIKRPVKSSSKVVYSEPVDGERGSKNILKKKLEYERTEAVNLLKRFYGSEIDTYLHAIDRTLRKEDETLIVGDKEWKVRRVGTPIYKVTCKVDGKIALIDGDKKSPTVKYPVDCGTYLVNLEDRTVEAADGMAKMIVERNYF